MPKALIITAVLALLGGCCAHAPDRSLVAEMPDGGTLAVFLNGQGPLDFGIDSGQSVAALVLPSVAARYGLPVVQKIDASDGVSSKPVDVVRIDALTLGGWTVRDQLGLVMAPGDGAMDGALGMPFFDGLLLEFDGLARTLRIERGELPAPDGRRVLAARLEHGLPVVPVTIAGHDHEALLDSGSQGGVLLPLSMKDELPLETPPQKSGRMSTLFGEFDLWTARLRGTVRLGACEVANPELTFSDHFAEINIGNGFLKRFRVTIDGKNARVRAEP